MLRTYQQLAPHLKEPEQLGDSGVGADQLLEELGAHQAATLLRAILHRELDQIVGHVVVAVVDKAHHHVGGKAAQLLRLGVEGGEDAAHPLLVVVLAHCV